MNSSQTPHPSIVAARQDLRDALTGVELDEQDQRYLAWFIRTCDQPTHHAFAHIIRAARKSGTRPSSSASPTATDPYANEGHGRRRT